MKVSYMHRSSFLFLWQLAYPLRHVGKAFEKGELSRSHRKKKKTPELQTDPNSWFCFHCNGIWEKSDSFVRARPEMHYAFIYCRFIQGNTQYNCTLFHWPTWPPAKNYLEFLTTNLSTRYSYKRI